MIRKLVLLCAALAVCAAMQPPAQAQVTLQPGDPGYDDVALVTVTPTADDTATVDPFSTKNDPTHTGRHYDAQHNCWKTWQGYIVTAWNKAGVTLWWFEDKMHDCVRNGNLITFSWDDPTHHECWCTLWNYKGWVVQAKHVTNSYAWRQVQGHLHYCIGISIAQKCFDAWPWVYVGGRGDGTFGSTGGIA